MAKVDSELEPLRAWHRKERERLKHMQEVRRSLEETKRSIEQLERRYNLDRVAELKYEVLPQLERQLALLSGSYVRVCLCACLSMCVCAFVCCCLRFWCVRA